MSCPSSISLIWSSSSLTRAARRSRNARWAARFWAFRLVGGVSVAGLRPGLGRGGITHSLEVTEPGVAGVGEEGEEAAGLAANAGARGGAGVTAGASGVAMTVVCLGYVLMLLRERELLL